MFLKIPSEKQRFKLDLKIQALRPCKLKLLVYDPTKPYSDYFRRRVSFYESGKRDITIKVPVSPKKLVFEIYNEDTQDNTGFKLNDFKINNLPKSEVWGSPARHRFMDFAIDFAQKAGYSKTGFYVSNDDEFLIQYLPKITDQFGKEIITPARIHRKMPRVQLSQKMFRNYTIPIRVNILAHEGCHYFMNTRDQTEADLCGLQYYLDYDFPKIEGIYSGTKIFGEHPHNVGASQVKRVKTIIDFVNNYEQKRQAA